MKTTILKKLIAFIITAMMFSVTANAQSELESSKTQIQPKPQVQSQPTKKLTNTAPSTLLAVTPHCYCNVLGWGCGALNWGCKLYCGSYCRHHSLISNGESNSTTVAFYIEEPGKVSLKLYDMTGRLITTLVDNSFEQGEHTLSWNSKDENGYAIAPGIYSLRMNAGEHSETEKLIVMK